MEDGESTKPRIWVKLFKVGQISLLKTQEERKQELIGRKETGNNKKEKCTLCGNSFSSKSNLGRHMRKMHKEYVTFTVERKPETGKRCSRLKCPLGNCDLFTSRYAWLRQHLLDVHGVSCELVKHKFPSDAGTYVSDKLHFMTHSFRLSHTTSSFVA